MVCDVVLLVVDAEESGAHPDQDHRLLLDDLRLCGGVGGDVAEVVDIELGFAEEEGASAQLAERPIPAELWPGFAASSTPESLTAG
ncbi:hypothetical protein [Nocardia sp. NPDC005366]|uniref:hypothetical protein n=1 Tax=Nocardia sp. NPDC005366 TaxID=3156878 RepID=UPI0033AB62E4